MVKIINESIKTISDLDARDYLDNLNVLLSNNLSSINMRLVATRFDDLTSRIYLDKKSILTIKVIPDKNSYTILLTDYQSDSQLIDVVSIFDSPSQDVVDTIDEMLQKLNLEESKKICTKIDI